MRERLGFFPCLGYENMLSGDFSFANATGRLLSLRIDTAGSPGI
jgi:hypothetical protein